MGDVICKGCGQEYDSSIEDQFLVRKKRGKGCCTNKCYNKVYKKPSVSKSNFSAGLEGLITKMRVLSDDSRELLDATDDAFMRGQYNGAMNTYELCADMISMYRKKAD